MTWIFVRDLELSAQIGAKPDERERRQRIVVAIVARVTPPERDQLVATVDYAALAEAARILAAGEHVVLAETFADRLADTVLAMPGVLDVDVTITKPEPLAPALVGARVTKGVDDDRQDH